VNSVWTAVDFMVTTTHPCSLDVVGSVDIMLPLYDHMIGQDEVWKTSQIFVIKRYREGHRWS